MVKLTKEEFEASYLDNSNISKEMYDKFFVTLPCACNYEKCLGWAAVSNREDSIRIHNDLYAPKERH
jgi:hypothetical protein